MKNMKKGINLDKSTKNGHKEITGTFGLISHKTAGLVASTCIYVGGVIGSVATVRTRATHYGGDGSSKGGREIGISRDCGSGGA